jgi:hypothetical protein
MKSNNLHVGALRAWWPALITAVGIFFASSMPASNIPGRWPPGTDKVVHALVYGLLAGLVARAWWRRARGPVTALQLFLAAASVAVGYGLTDEVHQLFVPGRHFELADLAADAVGASLGAFLISRACTRATPTLPS